MLYFWWSAVITAVAGLSLFPVYGYGGLSVRGGVLLCAAVLCAAAGSVKTGRMRLRVGPGPALLAAALAVVWVLAMPLPCSLGVLLVAGGVCTAALLRRGRGQVLAGAVVLVGLMLLAQTLWWYPYAKLAARFHGTGLCNGLLRAMLELAGFSTVSDGAPLYLQMPSGVAHLEMAWEKIGLYVAGSAIVCGSGVVALCGGGLRWVALRMGGLAASVVAYTLVRTIAVIALFVETGADWLFWKADAVAVSFVLLPFLLNGVVRCTKYVSAGEVPVVLPLRTVTAGAGAFLVSLALAGACFFHDPGQQKAGRVLIDEYYSNWEWTDRPIDTRWYGIQSVYNYYNLRDYLEHFYTVGTLESALTADVLAQTDVLIVKTPTRAFTPEEIGMIAGYVAAGGGLFLIGDHTNVFGTTLNLNPLARRFGFRFNYDATYNLETNDLHLHETIGPVAHPIVRTMPYFLFATSCSLVAPLAADDVMTAANLKAIELDYGRGGFFPDKKTEKNYRFGLFLQAAALRHGRGRVVAFTDSTCFSNFYMYIPGKPEFITGVIEWLNRVNRWHTPVLLGCALLCAAGFVLVILGLRRGTGESGTWLLCGAVAGLAVAAVLSDAVDCRAWLVPEPRTPFQTVCFETGHCDFNVPNRRLLHNPDIDYHTFYVWIQRLGFRPHLADLQELTSSTCDVAVLVNPQQPFSAPEVQAIATWVARGGRLLVLDRSHGRGSTARDFLGRFGLRMRHDRVRTDGEIIAHGSPAGRLERFAPVDGGEPLLQTVDGETVVAAVESGQGMVAGAACAELFTNARMGETETVPDTQQRFLYQLEFWLLSSLMQGEFPAFADYIGRSPNADPPQAVTPR